MLSDGVYNNLRPYNLRDTITDEDAINFPLVSTGYASWSDVQNDIEVVKQMDPLLTSFSLDFIKKLIHGIRPPPPKCIAQSNQSILALTS